MISLLTLLLAQATSSPSPTPNASSSGATSALTFSNALRRLIADAPDDFVSDRGAKVLSPKGLTGYHLNFAIERLTDCRIVPTPSFVACAAYRGADAARARSAYESLKAQLQAFAGRKVSINDEVTTASSNGARENPSSITDTKATYRPNDEVIVSVVMARLKTEPLVVLYVIHHKKNLP